MLWLSLVAQKEKPYNTCAQIELRYLCRAEDQTS